MNSKRYESLVRRRHLGMLALTFAIVLSVIIVMLVIALVLFGPEIDREGDRWTSELVRRYGLGIIGWPSLAVLLIVVIIKLRRL